MKILVAGASGFVGTALCRELKERGHRVFAADKAGAEYAFDLSCRNSIKQLLESTLPDAIVLLAGISNVSFCWTHPTETFAINVTGALGFFECHLQIVPKARFIFAGSAEEYGKSSPDGVPFKEDDICCPANPYALSKYSVAQAMKMLAAKHGRSFVHLRLANHYGPGQRKGFVTADFASQIAEKVLKADNSEIRVGNLQAQKDFVYLDDVIEAYVKIIEAEKLNYDTYNIGAGFPIAVRDILETLLKNSSGTAQIVTDPQKFRSADTVKLSLDITRISSELNWQPRTSLDEGLKKTLAYWIEKIQHS